MTKNLIIVGVVFILGIGIWFTFGDSDKSSKSNVDGMQTENAEADSNKLEISSQVIVKKATVDRANLAEPGYIVVREVIDNKLGQILEVSDYLPAGVNTDIEISLFDIPNDLADVIAVLYKDDGDESFNSNLDTRVSSNGFPVAVSFNSGDSVLSEVFSGEIDLSLIPEENITYITYTDIGYSPETIQINLGDTVVFVNESSGGMWAASDPHPAHTNLSSFDQFGAGEIGGQYIYTFDSVGVWSYHDHVKPSFTGTVIVQ